MKDLTFGEQVKIILSRKGMTIKELAERIQEETGKAMSRQNLTQRLGRDNFQEQDMRMIAAILGCPFRLSIFPMNDEEESMIDEDAFSNYAKKVRRKRELFEDDGMYQQEFVFDDTLTASVAELEEAEESEEELVSEPEAEEKSKEDQDESEEKSEEESSLEKQDRFRTSSIFRIGFGRNKKNKKAEKKEEKISVEELEEETGEESKEEVVKESEGLEEEPVKETELLLEEEREAAFESQEEEEPEKPAKPEINGHFLRTKVEEDLSRGELNPYTGHEYQTNSVRMHPSKIGYVQVYDRAKHGWVDMTEWAFLGYQEKMKKLLGKNYEPPTYLD